MQSKQKITLYIPPDLHRKLKIKAAVDVESMSSLVEKAVSFYIHNSDQIEKADSVIRKTHQVHFCPECESALALRDNSLVSLKNSPEILAEELPLSMRSSTNVSEKPSDEQLVIC